MPPGMTPEERYRRIDALLDQALELESHARTAFLDEACGDDVDLRHEIDALLASHDHSGSFLAAPAIEAAARSVARQSAPSLVGHTLGPYPIRALLGTGGMGDVYRAHDPRLGRDVAIKVLPPHLTNDREALARFEREVRAVAALSHPHILAIHDVGTDRGIAYAVMELVEGDTLRQRLSSGLMPWRKAVDIAVQIADGLAAAHAKGIIHRDLKPENVVLNASSQAKILDFGLARILPGTRPEELSAGGTTEPGMVMGTIGYMSPEQVRGQEAGPASDIFSLGCLLYEMVSGRPAFAAGTSTESLAAVLRDEPAPIGGGASDLPPALEPLIRHCLEKQASDRFQSASDFAFALRTVLGDARSTGSVSPSPEGVAARRVWRLPLAIVFGAVVGAASSTLWRTSAPASAGVVQLTWPLAAGLALAPNDSPAAGSSVAISRDGQWIAAIVQRSGQRFLAMRGIDRPDGTILPGTQGALTPVFSPDSRWVAFFTETDLRKVPIAGGTPTVLGPVPPVARGATWADDDNIYFSPSFSDGLWRMSASGGPMTVVSDVDFKSGESNHLLPEALPGARALLFTVWKGGDFSASQIWSLSLVSRERKLLLDAATAPRYVSPGFLVFARGGGLFAIRFDVTRLTTTGAAIPIVDGVWTDHLTGTAHYAVSPSGALVYAAGAGTVERRRLVWVDRHGGTQLLAGEPSFYANPRISPDGLKVAVEALNDLWIYDLGKTTLTRITFRGVNQLPVWSPDGRRIAVSSSHGVAVPTLFLVDADVAGTLKPISRAGLVEFPASWSRAGNVLAYAARRPFDTDTGWDVWVMHPGDDTPARALIQTPFKDDQPMLGPNGRALAYVSDETGRLEVYVQPYPSLGRRVRISTTGGTEPVWSRRGTELFYRSGRQYFSVPVSQAGETITVGRPFLMFEGDYVVSSIFPGVPSYDVSPDGQRFLAVARASDTPRIERLEVVLEWPRELERRLTPGGR